MDKMVEGMLNVYGKATADCQRTYGPLLPDEGGEPFIKLGDALGELVREYRGNLSNSEAAAFDAKLIGPPSELGHKIINEYAQAVVDDLRLDTLSKALSGVLTEAGFKS